MDDRDQLIGDIRPEDFRCHDCDGDLFPAADVGDGWIEWYCPACARVVFRHNHDPDYGPASFEEALDIATRIRAEMGLPPEDDDEEPPASA